MNNLYRILLKNPDLVVYYEDLIRELIRVREKFDIPWDAEMEEIMSARDWLYDELEKREPKVKRVKEFEEGLL